MAVLSLLNTFLFRMQNMFTAPFVFKHFHTTIVLVSFNTDFLGHLLRTDPWQVAENCWHKNSFIKLSGYQIFMGLERYQISSRLNSYWKNHQKSSQEMHSLTFRREKFVISISCHFWHHSWKSNIALSSLHDFHLINNVESLLNYTTSLRSLLFFRSKAFFFRLKTGADGGSPLRVWELISLKLTRWTTFTSLTNLWFYEKVFNEVSCQK